MNDNNILETERLILREFNLEDAPFVLNLVNMPSWLAFIGDKNVHSIEDAKQYLTNGALKSYAENGYGLSAIILKDSKLPIGMCGLVKRDSLEDIDIGFALLSEYAGQGYAYEIASATLRHAKKVLGIKKIIAITNANNTSSIKLISKLGLQFEKTVNLSINDSALLFSPIDKVADLRKVDELTNKFFSLFTNKDGTTPNVANIKNLFIPEGMIISNTGETANIYTLDEFIKPREEMLTDGTLTEFTEREITSTTEIFGKIAQRFCFYEKSGNLNGMPFQTIGMKTIQFVKINDTWKMSSVAWSDEAL